MDHLGWRALALVPLLIVMLALLRLLRAPRSERFQVPLPRFVVLSILVHVGLLFGLDLVLVSIPVVEAHRERIETVLRRTFAIEPATEAAEGRWSAVPDGPSPATPPQDLPVAPAVSTSTRDVAFAPELRGIAPTLPADQARALPPNRVLFLPPAEPLPDIGRLPGTSRAIALRPLTLGRVESLPLAAIPDVPEAPVPPSPMNPDRLAGDRLDPSPPSSRHPVDLPLATRIGESSRPRPLDVSPAATPSPPRMPSPPIAERFRPPTAIAAATPVPVAPPDEVPIVAAPLPPLGRNPSVLGPRMSRVGLLPRLPIRGDDRPPPIPPAPAVASIALPTLPRPIRRPAPTSLKVDAAASAPLPVARETEERPIAMRSDAFEPLPRAASPTDFTKSVRPLPPSAMPRTPSPLSSSGPRLESPFAPPRPASPPAPGRPLPPAPIPRIAPALARLKPPRDEIDLTSSLMLRNRDVRRPEVVRDLGGSEASESAVQLGLDWLAAHQGPDGNWSLNQLHCKGHVCDARGTSRSDPAATALALMAMLGAGQTTRQGAHAAAVTRGVGWLMAHQKPDGDLSAGGDSPMYAHGLATIALCEALALGGDPPLKDAAGRALKYIVEAQDVKSGGWRYTPRSGGDTSVVGWQLMALKSGEMAGLPVPPATYQGARRWLDSVASGPDRSRFSYQPGRAASPAMTAEALLCRQYLGLPRQDPVLVQGGAFLLAHTPSWPSRNSYFWYYATQVIYHLQGPSWATWNGKLREMLVESQVKDGHGRGSWHPYKPSRDEWADRGGRLYETALSLLMLEVYYRHLPLYQQLSR